MIDRRFFLIGAASGAASLAVPASGEEAPVVSPPLPLDPLEKALQDIEAYAQQVRHYRARILAVETDPAYSEFNRRAVQSVFSMIARQNSEMLEIACRDQLALTNRLCVETRQAMHASYEAVTGKQINGDSTPAG